MTEPARWHGAVRGDRVGGWREQTRSEALARHGVVCSRQLEASQAGLRVLQDGGTAADAAVATAAVLAVIEPEAHGIGGDTLVLYYSAADRRLHGLNSSGWSPSSWTPQRYRELGYDETTGMPTVGPHTATVPGAVRGWEEFVRRFGNRGFGDVLEPAVRVAEQGFGVGERLYHTWRRDAPKLRADPYARKTFLVADEPPSLYGIFRNPDLATALRALQEGGSAAFYEGPIAGAVVAALAESGGSMSRADLEEYDAEWTQPIHTEYHGHEVYQIGPNCQGFAALEMLNILAACEEELGVRLADLGPRSAQFWHLLVESKKLAYDDLERHNADPRFSAVPLETLLSPAYAREQCRRIDPSGAARTAGRHLGGGTVYLVAADRWGNMASFISSLSHGFGSGVGVPGYGFLLHNRGQLFSLDPAHPNVVAPRKRPFHTIMPGFVMKDGEPLLAFGNMGGSMQPQGQVQDLVNLVDLGMNVQAAGDAARFCHDQATGTLQLESALYDLVGEQLAAWGHRVRPSDGAPMGGYQAIRFEPDPAAAGSADGDDPPLAGLYRAGSDFRKDGGAACW